MAVESVAGCMWNGWPDQRGVGGRMAAESAGKPYRLFRRAREIGHVATEMSDQPKWPVTMLRNPHQIAVYHPNLPTRNSLALIFKRATC